MGAVKRVLAERTLKNRELHNSRLFVDLCENIHIHFREYRLIFSLDEYFEFVDVIRRSTQDARNYLVNNPDYREGAYPTTIMVGCGGQRQMKFLEHSPAPHRSAYHNDRLAIELQEEHVTDEIHVHWRDLRVALNRDNFRDVAATFTAALAALYDFESQHSYQRVRHPDRETAAANQVPLHPGRMCGATPLHVGRIQSYWFRDGQPDWFTAFTRDWERNHDYVQALEQGYRNGEPITPIVVSRPNDQGVYYIVNGHHRYLAARRAGLETIDAVALPYWFEETEELRQAEQLLKRFDQRTGYAEGASSFFNDFVAMKLNRFYRNDFSRRMGSTTPKENADGATSSDAALPTAAAPTPMSRRRKIKRFTKPLEDALRPYRRRLKERWGGKRAA